MKNVSEKLTYHFRYELMLRCWQEHPSDRPTFLEIREDLEEIMSQGETYITFDIDEDSNYYRTPSFNSAPREQEEDDAIADEITSEPNIVKAAVH